MAGMNVSLPGPMKDWGEARLEDGRFSNTSDYVRHLIRRDQEREEAIAALQQAVDEGLASGPARMRARHDQDDRFGHFSAR